MLRYCCKLVVIKEQFCNFTCTYYTYRNNKFPFKKKKETLLNSIWFKVYLRIFANGYSPLSFFLSYNKETKEIH